MLDIGWSELLIISVVALVVVGPKDLPKMFRTLGQVTGKARAMAREFQRAMDAAADDVGVKGLQDTARSLRETASGKTLRDAVGFDEIDRELRDIGRERPKKSPAGKPGAAADGLVRDPGAPDGSDDEDLDARNRKMAHTEAERLKRTERAAAARQKAADLRARRDAASEGSAGADRSGPAPSPASTPPAATPPASASPSPATEPDTPRS